MATVIDVAAYILLQKGPTSAMKLQKLVYYSQAWSLVWDEAPLFDQRIQAWSNGPVAPALYRLHRGEFQVSYEGMAKCGGDPSALTKAQRDTVDAVLAHYGDKDPQWLSDLTHMESPWREARKGLPDNVRGTAEITHASMAEYYGGLYRQ